MARKTGDAVKRGRGGRPKGTSPLSPVQLFYLLELHKVVLERATATAAPGRQGYTSSAMVQKGPDAVCFRVAAVRLAAKYDPEIKVGTLRSLYKRQMKRCGNDPTVYVRILDALDKSLLASNMHVIGQLLESADALLAKRK